MKLMRLANWTVNIHPKINLTLIIGNYEKNLNKKLILLKYLNVFINQTF